MSPLSERADSRASGLTAAHVTSSHSCLTECHDAAVAAAAASGQSGITLLHKPVSGAPGCCECSCYMKPDDSQISSSSKVRDLGVTFDNCLSLDAHISNICRSTHFHLRNIGRIRTLLTFHATAQLIHALITTRLDFCNSILYNLPNNKIKRLQRIQNQAARMLTRSPRRNHITPVLRKLHRLRISDRIIFKILILTHKAFHGVAPGYLCELITKHEQATVRTRRAQDCFLLAIPPINKTCVASFLERSFLYAAPTLWNKLSIDVRLMLEFNQFKSKIKTEL